MDQTISLHAHAPAKPPLGGPCNGCGVCCAAEPCPLGRLLFRRRAGACPALHWRSDETRYRCALAVTPRAVLPWLPRRLEPSSAARLCRRWIAAGAGCDSDGILPFS